MTTERETAKFQIRDADSGLALYEATSPAEALYAFLADKVRGEARPTLEDAGDGDTASLTFRGTRYTAVRAGTDV